MGATVLAVVQGEPGGRAAPSPSTATRLMTAPPLVLLLLVSCLGSPSRRSGPLRRGGARSSAGGDRERRLHPLAAAPMARSAWNGEAVDARDVPVLPGRASARS